MEQKSSLPLTVLVAAGLVAVIFGGAVDGDGVDASGGGLLVTGWLCDTSIPLADDCCFCMDIVDWEFIFALDIISARTSGLSSGELAIDAKPRPWWLPLDT